MLTLPLKNLFFLIILLIGIYLLIIWALGWLLRENHLPVTSVLIKCKRSILSIVSAILPKFVYIFLINEAKSFNKEEDEIIQYFVYPNNLEKFFFIAILLCFFSIVFLRLTSWELSFFEIELDSKIVEFISFFDSSNYVASFFINGYGCSNQYCI